MKLRSGKTYIQTKKPETTIAPPKSLEKGLAISINIQFGNPNIETIANRIYRENPIFKNMVTILDTIFSIRMYDKTRKCPYRNITYEHYELLDKIVTELTQLSLSKNIETISNKNMLDRVINFRDTVDIALVLFYLLNSQIGNLYLEVIEDSEEILILNNLLVTYVKMNSEHKKLFEKLYNDMVKSKLFI